MTRRRSVRRRRVSRLALGVLGLAGCAGLARCAGFPDHSEEVALRAIRAEAPAEERAADAEERAAGMPGSWGVPTRGLSARLLVEPAQGGLTVSLAALNATGRPLTLSSWGPPPFDGHELVLTLDGAPLDPRRVRPARAPVAAGPARVDLPPGAVLIVGPVHVAGPAAGWLGASCTLDVAGATTVLTAPLVEVGRHGP